jgi:protein-tyrosine phosphatase
MTKVREDFRILIVCTANIVRSPMAEVIAQAMLASSPCPILVTSAGTRARVGDSMAPHALGALRALGLDGQWHRGQSLSGALIDDSDLVLTMETAHRGAAVTLVPSAVHKTFTLREFAFLAERNDPPFPPDSVERAKALVQLVSNRRGAPTHRPLEISDPYGDPPAEYERCARVIGDSLSRALGALLGSR